ncbi:hypothetical protein ACLQ2E_15925 [Streptomyces lavendulocolor]
MAPKREPWRGRVVLHDVAGQQIDTMTDDERALLHPVIAELAADHTIGTHTEGRVEWEYRTDRVRVVYIPTVLGTVILVAYVEVG